MTILPVIERELRIQSRHGFTYGLRVLGVASVLLALVLLTQSRGLLPGDGGSVLIRIHDVCWGPSGSWCPSARPTASVASGGKAHSVCYS